MGKKDSFVEMDDSDRHLLRLLQADATLSNAALGEHLSMSVTPCWRRRKRLEDAGVITGYRATLDRRKLGYDVMAFAQVRFGEHAGNEPDRFEQVILQRPEVLSCHKITGEADYLLTVLAADLESYGQFIENVLRKQPGVAVIQSSLVLREVKATAQVAV
ncbi:MAG: Lrp/AsnC family transcriptional regulator [Corticimicrobacter sp.]|uniref:Lrp/AsnC family transcriptional regulator n=1 Tax=Corticimicrobacter sp. TaxID=2678536 RepID=UPI00117F01F2|nr:Lrp/AsnC family transcriptional regulator [Alcaligenaceae bacterium SJ-26]